MKNGKSKKRLRSFLIWTAWVLLVQFVLINISAALYAHKLTYYYPATTSPVKPASSNIFAKTWRLFTGPTFYRLPVIDSPDFGYTTIHLKTANNIVIEGWYAKADSVAKGTVLLFHGLTSNKGSMILEAGEFRNLGYNVLMMDSRAHGNSEGNITTIGYCEAEEVKLAYEYIQQKGEKNIFLMGVSMGAVEIVKAVSDHQLHPSGIIIEMPFLSLQSHLKARARILGFPEQPFAWLTSFWIGAERGFNGWGFNTASYAKDIDCPVLFQYGEKDELVLQYETDAIYKVIGTSNKKLVGYNAGHESLLKNDPATWKKETGEFLNRYIVSTF